MTYAEMIAEVRAFIKDPDFESSGAFASYPGLELNRAVKSLHKLVGTSPFLYTEGALTLTASARSVDVPTDFLSIAGDPAANGVSLARATINDLEDLDCYPYTEDTYPTHYAMVGRKIYLYPVPSATVANGLRLRYYRMTTDMSSGTDTPDGVPTEFHDLLCMMAEIRLLQWLGELEMLDKLFMRERVEEMQDQWRRFVAENSPTEMGFKLRTT